MEFYGTDVSQITSGNSNSGAKGDHLKLINQTLKKLIAQGVEAETFYTESYWTSSEVSIGSQWILGVGTGMRHFPSKYNITGAFVRCAVLIKDIADKSSLAPVIGDIMYVDKTWGAADDYDSRKTVVGVVSSVNGNDVTVLNLKNLRFSSNGAVNNFNPDAPYTGNAFVRWATSKYEYVDIEQIENFPEAKFVMTLNPNVQIITDKIIP